MYLYYKNFNGCDVRIENSVTRITVRHREACRTVIPIYGIFHSHRTTTVDSFSCILFLRLEYVLFYSILCRNNYIFQSRDVWFGSYLRCWRCNFWRKMISTWRQNMLNDIKMSQSTSWHNARESSYTSCKTTFPSPGWVHGNSGRVWKKRFVSTGENRGKHFIIWRRCFSVANGMS